MVALAGRAVVSVEIESAVGSLNLVDVEGDLVRTAEELGVMVGR
jgi:6-phosphofructokinase 1